MTERAADRTLSVEEYLRREDSSPVRHEYVAGDVYAMSGASRRHNAIVVDIASRLLAAARGGPCRVHAAEVKLRAGTDKIYYPDVMVDCTPGPGDAMVVSDPCLLVEVASSSTARVDRGEKLEAYRRIESLRAYLVVDQARCRVVRHSRDARGEWHREEVAGQGTVAVPCPEAALTLDEIYEGVDTSAVAEPGMAEYGA